MDVIEYLKTLPEGSNQHINIAGVGECVFLWFLDEDNIDVQPLGLRVILKVPRKHGVKISLYKYDYSLN